MKTFIFSYMFSLGIMVLVWMPDVLARPFHILPRLAFYIAFPAAVFLALALISIGSYFGSKHIGRHTSELADHQPAESRSYRQSA